MNSASRVCSVLFLAAWAGSSVAEPAADLSYLVTPAGCRFKNPFTKQTNLQVEWSGPCVNGFVEGSGEVIVTARNPRTYRGEFKGGQISSGFYETSNGSKYDGGFKDNLADGKGVWRYSNGTIMTATFSEDDPLPDG